MNKRVVAAPVVLLALASLAGCSSSASRAVTPPTPTGKAAAACKELDAHLPDTVDKTAAKATKPDSPFTAAWGDIVLVCGGAPADVPADAQLITVQGVDWYAEDLKSGGTKFTTVKRVAPVSVSVPVDHRPEANALVDLGPAISRYVLETKNSD